MNLDCRISVRSIWVSDRKTVGRQTQLVIGVYQAMLELTLVNL